MLADLLQKFDEQQGYLADWTIPIPDPPVPEIRVLPDTPIPSVEDDRSAYRPHRRSPSSDGDPGPSSKRRAGAAKGSSSKNGAKSGTKPVFPQGDSTSLFAESSTQGGARTRKHASASVPASGGVKTQLGVEMTDQSSGLTDWGKVVFVTRAGHGSRVVVNRGIDAHPFYDIHPNATFGRGVAAEWLRKNSYSSLDISRATNFQGLKQLTRLVVARTISRNSMRRQNREIQFYMIKAAGKLFMVSRSTLLNLKGNSSQLQDKRDRILDKQRARLEEELKTFKELNLHPNTFERLTSGERRAMPWLKADDDLKDDDEENVDMEDAFDEDEECGDEDSDESEDDEDAEESEDVEETGEEGQNGEDKGYSTESTL